MRKIGESLATDRESRRVLNDPIRSSELANGGDDCDHLDEGRIVRREGTAVSHSTERRKRGGVNQGPIRRTRRTSYIITDDEGGIDDIEGTTQERRRTRETVSRRRRWSFLLAKTTPEERGIDTKRLGEV